MQRKKKVKRIFIISLFIFSIILTSIQIYPNNLFNDIPNKNNSILNQKEDISSSSDGYLSNYYINGSGIAQDVRIYATNDSYTINKNQYFEIPSLSNTNYSYISYGNFNFTFQNNYTTDYILENTDALNARGFIEFEYDTDKSSITVNKGNVFPGDLPLNLGRLVDDNPNTLIRFNASNGIINFTVKANFSGTSYYRASPLINLNFNRMYILGLINQFSLRSTVNTYLTLRILKESTWKTVTEPIFIKSSSTLQNFDKRIINDNLNFIDLSDVSRIEFYFINSTINQYVVRVAELDIYATYGFDLPITNTNYVALEFDLKGKETNVNGFYAWIRTLNVSLAAITDLNITLYEANATIARTINNLNYLTLKPNYSRMIDSIIISNYFGDNLTYFKFNTSNTLNLKLYNYFIVIKSNRSEEIYSLVTLPRFYFGDPDNQLYPDHQLRISSDNGQSWQIARKTVPSTIPYLSERLDASSFKINVTRGYMPSDFWNSEEDNLNIEEIPIMNQINSSYPYNESSSLTWGLGQWKNNFTVPITAVPPNDFKIDLNWNKTIIKGFQFNVTYSVKAYWIEPTTTTYNVTYDALPEWTLRFNLNLTHSNLGNWNFSEFWFVFPSSYEPRNITNPINEDLYLDTEGESPDSYRISYEKVVVNKTLVNGISGPYTLQATSPNLIYEMHSYNNYMGNFWETNGFMFGDNMTACVDIRDVNGNPPNSGQANATLFYPESPGGEYPGGKRYDSTGLIEDGVLRYDFNNDTLLQIRNSLSYFGNYYLGFFWTNGSDIGCKKLELYIDSYNLDLVDCFYEPLLNQNILSGTVDKVFQNYSILIGTVNVTNDFDFYPVEKYNVDQEFSFNIGSVKIPILLKHFLQNETILNPDEDINVNITLQNMFELCDVEVKIQAQLVSLANENWIISEATSAYQTLKLKGDSLGRDTQEFSLNLTIPHLENDGIWHGVNAPVRKGGVMTKILIFIKYQNEDVNLGAYKSNYYALIVNSTQNDFEGYLLSLKYDREITEANILKPFKRSECIYLPNQTTFIVNIYDKNYISSYNDFIESFTLQGNSIFSNITIDPETPIRGQKFNLSAILTTEFGEIIPFGNITLQYYENNLWKNISSQIADNEGQINFEIDTLILDDEDQLLFRLKWLGDFNTLGHTENITVNLYRELNDLKINIYQNLLHLYRNRKATISIYLINTGESQLYIPASNISIISEPNLVYQLVEINYLELNRLFPNESTIIIVEIDVTAVKQITFNVSINARNIITDESIIFTSSTTFEVFDPPLEDYFIPLLTFIIVSIIILFWFIIYLFIRRLLRKIETPIEEPEKKKPKRGKYIKVSEIKKGPKKEKEQVEKTDLDSLLEEEGLKDKEKK